MELIEDYPRNMDAQTSAEIVIFTIPSFIGHGIKKDSQEIQESRRWVDTAEGVYKRDLIKRIELINWVLDNMKNPDNFICALTESKMNEIIDEINKKHSLIESDPVRQ